MNKFIIVAIVATLVSMTASCASTQDIQNNKVADTQVVEKQSKVKKSGQKCKRRATGQSRAKRC